MSVERRRDVRTRAMLRGKIVFNGGYCTMDCTVLDVSPSGARLQLSDWVHVPERFELRLPYGPQRQAALVHLRGSTAGIRFEAAPGVAT
jgi:hypothetical protein